MKTSTVLLPLLALVSGTIAHAQTRLYVDASVSSPGNGRSWTQAFQRLGPALAAARTGQEVWVATGTYTGGFAVPAGVTLVGGFVSGDNRITQRDIGDNACTLDGQDTQRVLTLGAGATVDGFFITRGRAGAPGGGGALLLGVRATLRNCGFLANNITAGRGSALLIDRDSNGTYATPLVENCLFRDNGKGTRLGPVIHVVYARGVFRNITVDRNLDNGLHLSDRVTSRIVNSTFSNNTGRGICHLDNLSEPTLEHCHFHNNTIALMHYRGSDLKTLAQVNAINYAKNIIDGDPRYTDASQLDYSLLPTSPLIDAGKNETPAAPQDVDGNSRWLDGKRKGMAVADIGIIEYSNIYLEYLGTPRAGTSLRIDTDGLTAPILMAVSLRAPANAFFLPQLGFVLVDTTPGFGFVTPWAPVNTMVTVPIPSSLPAGTSLLFQAAAGGKGSGNLSNPMDVRLR